MSEQHATWIYQARRVATQANVAGGAVKVDISLAGGQIARLISAFVSNSGTNDMTLAVADEGNNTLFNGGTIASGAARGSSWPNIGTATVHSNIANSTGVVIPSGTKLAIYQTGAGAQNDTLTIAIVLELFNLSTIPTWDKSRSTNAADVTIAASTISAANTLTPGRLWT